MKKVSIIGHFGFGGNYLDGQTIKTKTITEEMKRRYGKENVLCYDTHGKWRFILRLPFILFNALSKSKNVIILPAYKGVLVITPLLVILNFFFHRSLHYAVIGGWLPDYVRKYSFLKQSLKSFAGIYVETNSMKHAINASGLQNIIVMPNCKQLHIVSPEEIDYEIEEPIRICTFSRVMKEKGIEDAIDTIKLCNKQLGREAFTLDIYGQVWEAQKDWFDRIIANQPKFIRYAGCVDYIKSVDTLKNYFALLFPTFYKGEGFAGTLLDALFSGVPCIVSDWHSNADIIENGKNGFTISIHDINGYATALLELYSNKELHREMQLQCLRKAKEYSPAQVIEVIAQKLK